MDEVLARSGIFQGVDPESAESLAKDMDTIEARKGEVIFNEGEPGDSLYIILSGKVKLGRRAADGRQNLVAIMGPADMMGELSLFDPGPRTATARGTFARPAPPAGRVAAAARLDWPPVCRVGARLVVRRSTEVRDGRGTGAERDLPGG